MKASFVDGVRLVGVASAVPDRIVTSDEEAEVFGVPEMRKVVQSTGIHRRRVAPQGICTSDLCLAAVAPLLESAGWEKDTIDTLIFVSQTPDYVLPATACSLHGRLGLSQGCAAFDVNLGCSGYTYGSWLASHLIASRAAKRILLLAGEIASRTVNPRDRSARPLFGDAGTATLLEAQPSASKLFFRFGTDGSGQNNLIVPSGSFRSPATAETSSSHVCSDGNTRALTNLYMNGAEIFSFTISHVPDLLRDTVADTGWQMSDVDAFVLHQANEFMLKHIARSAQIPLDKVPLCLGDFGNTSSASIPLALTVCLREKLATSPMKLVLAGFGVGYSWSSVAVETQKLTMPALVEVNCDKVLDDLHSVEATSLSHLPEDLRSLRHGCV